MAEIAPLPALRYDLDTAGPLQALWAPPYDVIDAEQRTELAARSPYNAVRIDLPEGEPDRYAAAAAELARWRDEGAVVADREPAIWALEQAYRAPDGRDRVRRGFLCRVRVEEYGPGRIRPHERTHPGPREDRLRLTRATHANLSPIFSLFSDPAGRAAAALGPHTGGEPWGEVLDDDGNRHRLWRVTAADAVDSVVAAVGPTELLIADGHHRYETARVYAEEAGTAAAGWVLMCLVALEDPGLTVFPTHRLVSGTTSETQEALADAIRRDWDIETVSEDELAPSGEGDAVQIGYIDAYFRRPFRLTLKEPAIAERALPDRSAAYRRLDTAVTEALLLKGALGLTDERIDHLDGFGYARDDADALRLVQDGTFDCAFFMGPTPVERIAEVAAAGETMPPKSTYFFPKILTGLVFNSLE